MPEWPRDHNGEPLTNEEVFDLAAGGEKDCRACILDALYCPRVKINPDQRSELVKCLREAPQGLGVELIDGEGFIQLEVPDWEYTNTIAATGERMLD